MAATNQQQKPKRKQAPRKPSNGKVGAPKLDIDVNLVRDLARIHCTMEEIAAIVGCHIDTLRDNFSNDIKKGQEEGRASLRRSQYKAAVGGNPAMMIWLGKQLLGQREPRDGHADDTQQQPEDIVWRESV